MSINKQNHLYVYVKGHKGRGAFVVTDSHFNPQYSEPIVAEEDSKQTPLLMDLKAIERSLEYIKDNRGKGTIPKEPVISVFTTYENNYHVASGLKKPQTEEMKEFIRTLKKLKTEFIRPGQKQRDEIKCYWIPDDFENRIVDVKILLKKKK